MTTRVSDNRDLSRYEIHEDGALAGFTQYDLDGEVIAFPHTEIDPEFGGRGLGSIMIREALDDARRRRLTVQPSCPFVARFIAAHDDYLDLVAEADRGRFGLA